MRYPIGNQDFRALRNDGYFYLDKTEQICRILDAGKYFFLSRPRRFGKSLTVSTCKELYSGDRELFEGLWAYDNWDFAKRQRPVIHIKFEETDFQNFGMEEAIQRAIDGQAERLGVEVPRAKGYAWRFRQLVEAVAKTHAAGRCVVLIDEYDKPIINYLNDLPKALENRDFLRPFYGVLKGADEFLDFVFITGVSAFSKISLFSDLNNIQQLTLDPLAHTLVGFTEAELDAHLAEQLADTNVTRGEIKKWYNGYTWGGDRVYNPWSIIHLLTSGQRENYWASSGTPKFVTDVLAQKGIYNLEGVRRSRTELTSFDLQQLDTTAILWQGGYLTLDGDHPRGERFRLRYPNEEVRRTFTEVLMRSYSFQQSDAIFRLNALEDALLERDLETFSEEVDAILSAVPYELWQDATERFYHAVLITAFRYIGSFDLRAEVSSARGRADVVLFTEALVYAIEFKLLRPTAAQLTDEAARAAAGEALAEAALVQIAERDYLGPHRGGQRECVALAVVFDAERRKVAVMREG